MSMLSSAQQPVTAQAVEVLTQLHRKGVKLWEEEGRLRYRVVKGTLNRDDLQTLSEHKGEILALLASMQLHSLSIKPREQMGLLPLSYSQLSHWHRYRLGERQHLRQLACATRLSGLLCIKALRDSFASLFQRHDALRTSIHVIDGTPLQRIDRVANHELEVLDLSALSADSRDAEVRRHVESFIGQLIDVTTAPLFGALLLRLSDHEHVLVVTMEHMISDGISLNIFMTELFEIYEGFALHRTVALPSLPLQFPDYACWQRDAERGWIEARARQLSRYLSSTAPVRFPAENGEHPSKNGWGVAPVTIDQQLRHNLRSWCQKNGVTLAMTVFAAYAALILRWCKSDEMVIRHVADGRITAPLQNAIGYFAYLMFLKVSVQQEDTPRELIRRVTEEYCSAQEHPHLGCIEAQPSLPEFGRGFGFNWVPAAERIVETRAARSLQRSPFSFEHPILHNFDQDLQPFALFYDTEEGITGGVHYPRAHISHRTMSRFSRCLVELLAAFVARPEIRIVDIPLEPPMS